MSSDKKKDESKAAHPLCQKQREASIKSRLSYVLSSYNKYVQYRLMNTSFSTTESDWQGVDDEPTARSNNLIKGGGVAKEFIDMRVKSLLTPFESNEGYLVRSGVGEAAHLQSNSHMTVNKYNVVARKAYGCKS